MRRSARIADKGGSPKLPSGEVPGYEVPASHSEVSLSEVSQPQVKPEDSVSNVSARSSVLSINLAMEKAKLITEKAELEARVAAAAEKYKLQQEKWALDVERQKADLEFRRKEEEINLRTELRISASKVNCLQQEIDECEHLSAGSSKAYLAVHKSAPVVNSDMSSIVKELRKPVSDISKFDGDPLKFLRFMRQFESKVLSFVSSDDERLNYLEQYTVGEPNKIVQGYGSMPSDVAYSAVMKEFQERYGDNSILANAYITKALGWHVIKADQPKHLDDFGLFLLECLNAVGSIDAIAVLEYPDNLRHLMTKLPFNMQDKWRSRAYDLKEKNNRSVKFADFVNFVRKEAKKTNDPIFGRASLPMLKSAPVGVRSQGRKSSASVNASQSVACIFCAGSHALASCQSIRSKPLRDRLSFLRNKGTCFGCLRHGHHSKQCRNKSTCSKCGKLHPTILHDNRTANGYQQDGAENASGVEKASAEVEYTAVKSCGAVEASKSSVGPGTFMGAREEDCTMVIVPVKVKVRHNITVNCYAFLDPGSNVSFCTSKLAHILRVTGAKTSIVLETMNASQKMNVKKVQGLEVSSLDGEKFVKLPVLYTKDSMPVSQRHIPTKADIAKWEHLENVPVPEIDGKVMLLIGNNMPEAYTPYEIRTGPTGSPYASRTALGWVLWNVIRNQGSETSVDVSGYQVNRADVKVVQDADKLEKLLRSSINMDFPERIIDMKREHSQEDLLFNKKVSDSMKFVDGHYSIGLPFRDSNMVFPDNRSQALHRLRYLRKKLETDHKFYTDYADFMRKVIDTGYAEKAPLGQATSNGRIWYIPHHGVYHPRKQKLRVVLDCAARYHGISLNDTLLQGPNMTSDLLSVLLRFRRKPFAVTGDIESMFYRVTVPPEDRDSLRFFWWPDGDLVREPEIYRMTVHLFGASSSPACANTALRQTAIDHGHNFEKGVSDSVFNNFYVDDCLHAVESVSSGISLVRDLSSLCNLGGFRLTKWSSNNKKIIASIPHLERSKELQTYQLDMEVVWRPESDCFGFILNLPDRPITRRGILSTVYSVYDPLGLASPMVLPAKILLQSLNKQNIGWDDPIPESDKKLWQDWLQHISAIERLEVQRSVKPRGFEVKAFQLHVFCDASDSGYGVAVYIRLLDSTEEVSCSLLMAKARVAPLKKVTTPRMELTAATMAVKIANMVVKAVDYEFEDVYYWTDSTSVLKYIQNTTTRFHTFVANRLTIIHEGSSPSQWRYVSTKENPADAASRGVSLKDQITVTRWLKGPSFLWSRESEWPAEPISGVLPADDPEVRKVVASAVALSEESSATIDLLLERFSSWEKLKKTVAWFLRAQQCFKERKMKQQAVSSNVACQKPQLSVEELDASELAVMKYLQRRCFTADVFSKQSSIRKLDLFQYEDGVLRVGGRLARATVPSSTRHPIILPGSSPVTSLIVDDIHKQLGHSGRNAVLSKLRERYWVTSSNRVVKNILSRCVACRRYRAKLGSQKMADLPVQRVVGGSKPFTYTGVDFFGPLETRLRRSTVKRYGVVFTCFETRACHLELANSLNMNSCINAIRRFVARRGAVKWMRSDNGTNLVGAEREMREAIQAWNTDKMHSKLQQHGIEWEFNTPTASHHGGVWERVIRSVRKVLYGLMREQTIYLNDEGLYTLLCEVESVVNSRPLTVLSDDARDPEPLTPNHLLMFQPAVQLPPGTFTKDDTYVRRRWRQIQYLSDIFWNRWRREYLVMLQERQKWQQPSRNMEVGDVVLIADKSPRNQWLMGRITEVKGDKKGFVRIAVVKTATSLYERPITKLCTLLENES